MSVDLEEKHEIYKNDTIAVSTNNIPEIPQAETRQTLERQLVRKLDYRLLPTIVLIHFMSNIDRAAISSARLKGLQTDLRLSDVQYDTVLASLYVSYGLAHTLSNMALNYISRPALYIGTCAVVWGLITALTGITHNFVGIVACRILIGFPEASFFPGAVYLLSRWYTRKELAFRVAILHIALLMSNGFGGLWAAAILGGMHKVMGIAAWRWLFYIEGTMTIIVGFFAMWSLSDYPHNTRWLTPAERYIAQVRLAEDAGEADKDPEHASIFQGLKLAIKDVKVPIFMLMVFSQLLGLSFTSFFPTLTATLGYSTTIALLMTAPPWTFATIASLVNSRHADITGERCFHLMAGWWIAIVGFIISLSTMNMAARYTSMFIMTSGFSGSPLVLVWLANVVPRPPAKRSAAIGLVTGFGSLGILAGSYIWKARWGPEYRTSFVISLCALVFASCLCFVLRALVVRENRRLECAGVSAVQGPERERIEEAARLEGITFDEALKRKMEFRYLY